MRTHQVWISPSYSHFVQPRRERAPKAGVAGVTVDRFEVVLAFAVKARADTTHLVGSRRVNRLGGFLLRVHAERSQKIGHAHHPATGLLEPREQIPVQRELITRVDSARNIPRALSPEQGFLGNVVDPFERRRIVAGHYPATDVAIIVIDDNPVAVDYVDFRMRREVLRDVAKRTRGKQIVRV